MSLLYFLIAWILLAIIFYKLPKVNTYFAALVLFSTPFIFVFLLIQYYDMIGKQWDNAPLLGSLYIANAIPASLCALLVYFLLREWRKTK